MTRKIKRKPNFSGKGQMEIMGLLVIVILIMIIIFFSLSFSMRQASTQGSVREDFSDKKALAMMGPTILETSVVCGSSFNERVVSLRELASDCAFSGGYLCSGSCRLLNDTIDKILEKTLDLQGFNYTLTLDAGNIGDSESVITNFSRYGCSNNARQRTIEVTPIATRFGTMKLELINCN